MESSAKRENTEKTYTVDLSQSLSVQELARFEAEAKSKGKTLKAYTLSLLLTQAQSMRNPMRDPMRNPMGDPIDPIGNPMGNSCNSTSDDSEGLQNG